MGLPEAVGLLLAGRTAIAGATGAGEAAATNYA